MPSPPITWLWMVPLSVRRRVPLSCSAADDEVREGPGCRRPCSRGASTSPLFLSLLKVAPLSSLMFMPPSLPRMMRRRARGLEGGGMVVGVRVRQRRELAVEPPGLDRPGAAAVRGARRGQVAADPDRVARRRPAGPPGPSGCTSTAPWQMFMFGMPAHGIGRHLGGVDAVGDPGLPAVRGAVDVPHRGVGLRCSSTRRPRCLRARPRPAWCGRWR